MAGSPRALAVVGLAWLLLVGCDDDEPEADDPEATEQPAPGTVADLTPVEIGGLGPEVGTLELHDVHGDDAGWLAVGAATEPGARPSTVALAAADGEEWAPLALPAPETPEHRARAVARVGDVTVVVGTATSDEGSHLIVWTDEGDGWSLTEHPEESDRGSEVVVHNVVGLGGRAVAVGALRDDDESVRPAAWLVAVDGSVGAADLDDVSGRAGFLRDVAGDEDELLAVGALGDDEQATATAMLRSEDEGRSWQEVAGLTGLEDALVHALEVDGDGWLAGGRLGAGEQERAAAWSSDDGEEFTSLGLPTDPSPSHVRGIHRLDDRSVAVGSWLYAADTDGFLDGWHTPSWPGPGEHGWFGASAAHDGRIVAVGGIGDEGVTGLLSTTDGDEWTHLPVAEQVLEATEGALARWVSALSTDGEHVVGVGGQVVLEGAATSRAVFAGLAPAFAPVGEPVEGPGQLAAVVHVEGVGHVAVGSTTAPEFDHAGVRAFLSPDGQRWTALEVDETADDDRARTVLPTDGGVLVAGLGWDDGAPVSYVWRLEGDRLERVEVPRLDGFGIVDGCSGGELVALQVFPGDATRLLAVSQDGGESFSIVGEGPLVGAADLSCAVDEEGELLVATSGQAAPGVYRLTADGRFEPVELDLGADASIEAVRHLPEIGWTLLASHRDGQHRDGRVHVSRDLTTWVTVEAEHPDEAAPRDTAFADAVVAGGRLLVIGDRDDTTAMWALDLDELP